VVGVLTVPETSAQEAPEWATETPEQRCARQTAEWDASMEAAWRAAHPGQEPGPGAWPPYICVDVPTPDVPVPPVPPVGGGSVTVGNPPGREHQWDIRGDEPSEYRQDMRLGSARDHRTAPQAGTTATSGPRAGDSARSNVSLPSGWSTTATDSEGNPRDVRVVDTEDGVLVVDPEGRATGDVLVTDPDTGESRLEHRDGVSGHEVGAPEDRENSGGGSGGSAGPQTDNSAGAAAAGDDETDDIDPAVPVGVAGALAGGFVAVRGSRGFRNGRGGSGRTRPGTLPGLDAAPRVTINHLTGAEQTIFALLSPASDHTQEFDLNIPEGGHAEVRPDGGVDVLDADGTLVRQVAPPWAFDARGIPQPTWFTIDPETGNLVQHVAPLEGALYPIIADPNKKPRQTTPKGVKSPHTQVGLVDTTGRQDGETWTQQLPNGEVAEHNMLEGTGGQSVHSHTERSDGSYSDVLSVSDGQGGYQAWSQNSDGTGSYNDQTSDGDGYTELYDPSVNGGTTPAVTSEYSDYNQSGTVAAVNPNGTTSTADYERTQKNQYSTDIENPDGSETHVTSTDAAGDRGVSTMISDESGISVHDADGTVTPVDKWGNMLDEQGQVVDGQEGRFYDEGSGTWHNGTVDQQTGGRTFLLEDGSRLKETPQGDGTSKWDVTDAEGNRHQVDSLGWDPATGDPVDIVEGKDTTPDKGDFGDGVRDGAKELWNGVSPLVGLGGEGAPGVIESWGNLADSTATLAGAHGETAKQEALTGLLSDTVAADDFSRGDVDYAAGKATFNILSELVGTRGAGGAASGAAHAADAASDAARAARTVEGVGEATGKAPDLPRSPGHAHSPQSHSAVDADHHSPPYQAPAAPEAPPDAGLRESQVPSTHSMDVDSAKYPDSLVVADLGTAPRTYDPSVPDGLIGPRNHDVAANLGQDILPDGHDPFGGGDYRQFVDDGFWDPDEKKWIYPPEVDGMAGALPGTVQVNQYEAGHLFDRIGGNGGTYLGNPGESVPLRSLPPWNGMNEYHVFELGVDLQREGTDYFILSGEVAPWFNQPGMGHQFQIIDGNTGKPLSIEYLLENGILGEVEE
jgi:hypothetical protein